MSKFIVTLEVKMEVEAENPLLAEVAAAIAVEDGNNNKVEVLGVGTLGVSAKRGV